MGRRKRNKKDPPDSAAWSSYKPNKSRYWFHGGPWVPPDQIPAASGYTPEQVRPHEKPMTRLKSVGKLLEDARLDLEKELALYVGLHERGYEALPWPWMVEKLAKGDFDPGQPNHIHYSFCQAYGGISRLRAQIAAYRAVIEGDEPFLMPLFHQKKNG